MKLSPLLLDKWTRKPYRYTYKMPLNIYPNAKQVVLKNFVRGSEMNKKLIPCLTELTDILECLKQNEMDDRKCNQQIFIHSKCQEKSSWKKIQKNITRKEGYLTTQDLNNLMDKYPLPYVKRQKGKK